MTGKGERRFPSKRGGRGLRKRPYVKPEITKGMGYANRVDQETLGLRGGPRPENESGPGGGPGGCGPRYKEKK